MHQKGPLTPPKPKLRGIFHEWAAYASALLGPYLIAQARTPEALHSAIFYSLALFFLFGVSAFYHRPHWSPRVRMWLRRLDHCTIYVFIAATALPIAWLRLDPSAKRGVEIWISLFVAVGLVKSLIWIKAPKLLTASLYVAAGLGFAFYIPDIAHGIGPKLTALLLIGGAAYLTGAVVYAFRKPNPWPKTFGYHEIFHIAVLVGAGFQFWVISRIIQNTIALPV